MSDILKDDIQNIFADVNISWHMMRNSTILITDATGLIVGVFTYVLAAAKEELNLNIQIIAHGRNMEKNNVYAQEFVVKFIVGDIREPLLPEEITDKTDYIFYCAAIAKSVYMTAKPVGVITTNVDGTQNIFELARWRGCRSLSYLSSMEIYGQNKLQEVGEHNLGYLDLSSFRSSYPESNRLCEMLRSMLAARQGR